jgi:hypothetical protein
VSPESLARFFPATADLFDIVVFDEASQVRVADAIGAMGRAGSVVVVGDSKQMPPTSVAESTFGDDDLDAEEGEVVVDEESILTECVQARVASHRLSWHYRSQDESLIAFSNQHYYDGELASFPSPGSSGTGVSLVRVDGHFHRTGPGETLRTNPVEARAIVAEIRRRFAEEAPSVGVVTFNLQQRAYIEGLLRDTGDQRLLAALEVPDGLFVKNLENVQGDERDVILFSTAFSVNDRGVLPLNFGPLNRTGGERRLNVAVTRARRQVIVYSSFDPEQLRAEQTSSVGLRHLRAYLEMAAHGSDALPRDRLPRLLPDPHRDEIADQLRKRGLPVRTNVGLSSFALDLVLGEPGDRQVAVLLDGPPWARRLTARDRDALPREVLTDVLHWPAVERVWLPDWLADPDSVIERLQAATTTTVVPVPPQAPTPAPPVIARDDPPSQVDPPFTPWRPGLVGGLDVLDALPSQPAASRIARTLLDAVTAEGPIHTDRLARLVANSYGLNRVADSRKRAILRHLPADLRDDPDEPVIWPPHLDPDTWTGYRRTPDDVDRPLDHVPQREIVNAMATVARSSAGISRDELHTTVLAIFGGRRRTPGITDRLDAALTLGLRLGRLTTSDNTVHAA